jgi:hypothetical protein
MPFASLYMTGSLKDITGAGPGLGLTLLSKADCAIVAVTNSKPVAAIISFFIV